MKVDFYGGLSLTTQELAEEVRKEGKLYRYKVCNEVGERCVLGVIEDWDVSSPWRLGGPRRTALVKGNPFFDELGKLTVANDEFKGTPEERCEYMAGILEDFEG
jgi:hypothetical protein